jgi:hypothetical protein
LAKAEYETAIKEYISSVELPTTPYRKEQGSINDLLPVLEKNTQKY